MRVAWCKMVFGLGFLISSVGGCVATERGGPVVFESIKHRLSLVYPSSLLTVSEEEDGVLLVHRVQHRHEDPCDFEAGGSVLEYVTDFRARMTTFEGQVTDAFRTFESDFVISKFMDGDGIRTSDGFIDRVELGSFRGYQITVGSHGCGVRTLYLNDGGERTLVVEWFTVPELSGSYRDKQTVLELPGLLKEDAAKSLLDSLISGCTVIR